MTLDKFFILILLIVFSGLNVTAQTTDSIATVDTIVIDSFKVANQDSLITPSKNDSFATVDAIITDSFKIANQDSLITPANTDSAKISEVAKSTKESGYEIEGIIKDKNTGEGIPFATIFFPGTGAGTAADLDGNFSFKFPSLPKDTLKFQAVGYNTVSRKLDRKKNKYTFTVELDRTENSLEEFVFHYKDPAVELVKHIIERKPYNNPDRTINYKYEAYNKLEVDLERLTRKQFEKIPIPYMKKFSFIFDNLDTTSEETPFLPFYFTETLSDYYFQRNPKKQKEFIKASLVKGVKNESVTKFLGSFYQSLNAYENFLPVFDKQFVSPISNAGLFYYKYKIKDTQEAYGHKIILVQFKPKRNGENCFFGDFWVVDSVYALQRISMQVPKDANINWVSRVSLYQEFAPVSDSIWFGVKDKFIADFTLPYSKKLPGFIGRKTTSYKNIVLNDSSITTVVNNPAYKEDVMVSDTARSASMAFWASARHDTLNKNERAVYKMIDTLESMPLFTTYKNMIKFAATGTKEFGPIELGPIWNIYSTNPVEGTRIRFSMGTTPKLFPKVYLNGYLAYGTKDEALKYKASALWIMNKKPRMYLYGSYIKDIDRSTSYYDQVSNDNLFSNFFRKPGIPWKLSFLEEQKVEWFKEFFSGISYMLTVMHRDFNPYDPLPDSGIFQDGDGKPTEHTINTEVNLKLRFAYKEKFLEGAYYRVSLGSDYPVGELRYGRGIKNLWDSGYEYDKLTLSVSHTFKIAPLGKLYVNTFAGKYFGTLPYPLLEIHPGNEFYYYNQYAFNMMNRYEFLSDQYAGINVEHNIGGGVFNYIPYLKKIKMRQFWTAKVLYGSLTDENQKLNLNKGYSFRTLKDVPYVEVGTGISNIFQLFRIDLVWRVSPDLLPNENNERYFGIFGSVRFGF
jgi:hypothetical protein